MRNSYRSIRKQLHWTFWTAIFLSVGIFLCDAAIHNDYDKFHDDYDKFTRESKELNAYFAMKNEIMPSAFKGQSTNPRGPIVQRNYSSIIVSP